jgi:hypothetical protein
MAFNSFGFETRSDQGGPDWSGCNGIHAYTPFDKVEGQTAGKCHDSSFCGGIIYQVTCSPVSGHRSRVDNIAPFFHMRERRLCEPEKRIDIGGKCFNQLCGCYIFQLFAFELNGSIVYQYINFFKFVNYSIDKTIVI